MPKSNIVSSMTTATHERFKIRSRRIRSLPVIAEAPTFFQQPANRPVGVKRFQTIHDCGVDIARGLVLLYGIGTEALPSWDSKTRWNDLLGGLAVGRAKQTRELTSSIVPRGTSFHHLVELEFCSY